MNLWYRAGALCCLFAGIFCLCCLFSSCRSVRSDPFAACRSPFRARISGELNGNAFCAGIAFTEAGRRIRFTAPALLEGLELTVSGGNVTMTRNGRKITTSEEAMQGLLRPLTILTETTGTPERVEKQGDQYTATYPGGISLTVSAS